MPANQGDGSGSLTNLPTRQSMLDGMAAGSNVQWERFERMYTPLIKRVGRRYGVATADLDALVNTVMTALDKTMRVNSTFNYSTEKGRFRSYVYTAAKHAAMRKPNGPIKRELLVEPAAEDHDVLQRMEIEQCLYDTLQSLEDEAAGTAKRDIEIFRRAVLNEEPTESLADEYGIDAGRVYGIKSEVRSLLRARFRRDWGDFD